MEEWNPSNPKIQEDEDFGNVPPPTCYLCDKVVDPVEIITDKGPIHLECSMQALREAIRGNET